MRLQAQPINVVSILGSDYSIKAPAGQEETLAQAVRMLNSALSETKRQYPTLIGDKLLVLAALNLCSRQVELQRNTSRPSSVPRRRSTPRWTPLSRLSLSPDIFGVAVRPHCSRSLD